ncbi:hypothetical protein BX661DRAFT_191464 [Kickxella alabastrina]|uniref:uncharacterized protein n=1 Tax=Kickxella alabastrina TaxID=61397 RepID=UPI00221FC2C5|nr:uncharacterized protein BX661DRAFT_191464 [Kickxella alabastrina]KAI7818611.1 hypothetical protein BX661DRAFT_191464 [Kickxella alabastrina]
MVFVPQSFFYFCSYLFYYIISRLLFYLIQPTYLFLFMKFTIFAFALALAGAASVTAAEDTHKLSTRNDILCISLSIPVATKTTFNRRDKAYIAVISVEETDIKTI